MKKLQLKRKKQKYHIEQEEQVVKKSNLNNLNSLYKMKDKLLETLWRKFLRTIFQKFLQTEFKKFLKTEIKKSPKMKLKNSLKTLFSKHSK